MVFIFVMSAQPKPPEIPILGDLLQRVDETVTWSDKIKHFIAYSIMGGLAWKSLGDGCSGRKRFWLAVGISAVYGATDEYHQRFVVGRSCDICDWTADILGASVGAMIIGAWGRLPRLFRRR